jgi:hypothetical protein
MLRWLRAFFVIVPLLVSAPTSLAQSPAPAEPPAAPSSERATTKPVADPKKPVSPESTLLAGGASIPGGPPASTLTVDAFQADLFTGAATAEVPIAVPLGAGGSAPRIVLRYNSSTVDELGTRSQGQWTGLGWTLDLGGFIVRDARLTTTPHDDTFKLVFGGVSHDLVRIDAINNIFHTKDETFLQLQYIAQSDYWMLTTKDGIRHRLGFNPDSKAIALGQDLTTPATWKYLLDEVTTPSGVSLRYAYVKQTATAPATGRTYDQAVYPQTITWSYASGTLVGAAREVRFLRTPRADWTDTTATTQVSFHERDRLDAIELRVGGQLVHRYRLGYDYSIDRDPGHVWDGGVAGDLTLRSITVFGTDGTSALPAQTFSYSGAYLASAGNGLGGNVSFTYDQVATLHLYSSCARAETIESPSCVDWTAGRSPDLGWASWVPSTDLTDALAAPQEGSVALWSACRRVDNLESPRCEDWMPSTSPDLGWGFLFPSTHLGYVLTTPLAGMVPL